MHLLYFAQYLLGMIFTLEDTRSNLCQLKLMSMTFTDCKMAPKLINHQTV